MKVLAASPHTGGISARRCLFTPIVRQPPEMVVRQRLEGAVEVLRILLEDLEELDDIEQARELVRQRLRELEECMAEITRSELGWLPARLVLAKKG